MHLFQKKYPLLISLVLLLTCYSGGSFAQAGLARDRICGKWENEAKTLRIQISRQGSDFIAKIIWFSDTEGKPMNYWKDKRNPNPKLRNRTILGMNILRDLKYNDEKGSWEDGIVYDSRHGKEWNASATINKKGQLKVRGYWHLKWIGKTMIFNRLK
jgi:uncharacterized protein (DUF2147 family)